METFWYAQFFAYRRPVSPARTPLHQQKGESVAEQKLTHIEAGMVEKMAGMLSRHSPEEVQTHLGIGINTWTKLRKGEAIRRSVAMRLLERVEARLAN
jgi:hypothetical protein